MNIRRTSWLVIIIAAILGAVLGFALSRSSTTTYQANAQLYVTVVDAKSDNGINKINGLNSGSIYVLSQMESYQALVNSPQVTVPVIKRLGLAMSETKLANKITADTPLRQALLNIHVADASSQQAIRIARAVSEQSVRVIEGIGSSGSSTANSPLRATIVQPARTAQRVRRFPTLLTTLVGLLAGALLGLLFAVIRAALDRRLVSVADVAEATDVPVLGVIPVAKGRSATSDAGGQDAYRRLAAYVLHSTAVANARVIGVASATNSEGRSSVASHLAFALAETGRRVCLVEADLREPSLAAGLGLSGSGGLAAVLVGAERLDTALVDVRGLAVLVAGDHGSRGGADVGELLAGHGAASVFAALRERFDVVIVDTAALLSVADGVQAVGLTDATLLVVRAGSTRKDDLSRALAALRFIGTTPIGLVVNRARSTAQPLGSNVSYRQPEFVA